MKKTQNTKHKMHKAPSKYLIPNEMPNVKFQKVKTFDIEALEILLEIRY